MLERGDCLECRNGYDSPAQDHDCAGIGNSTFSRFHLLSYFLEVVYIAWDTLEIKEVLDNFKTLIKISLLRQGFSEEQIAEINTHNNILFHVKTDRCLHKVFNDLWVRNPEPIDIPDPHDHHHHSQVMQMEPDSSINDDDIIKYEPMWPVQDGPDNEMAAGTLAEQLQAMVERL